MNEDDIKGLANRMAEMLLEDPGALLDRIQNGVAYASLFQNTVRVFDRYIRDESGKQLCFMDHMERVITRDLLEQANCANEKWVPNIAMLSSKEATLIVPLDPFAENPRGLDFLKAILRSKVEGRELVSDRPGEILEMRLVSLVIMGTEDNSPESPDGVPYEGSFPEDRENFKPALLVYKETPSAAVSLFRPFSAPDKDGKRDYEKGEELYGLDGQGPLGGVLYCPTPRHTETGKLN